MPANNVDALIGRAFERILQSKINSCLSFNTGCKSYRFKKAHGKNQTSNDKPGGWKCSRCYCRLPGAGVGFIWRELSTDQSGRGFLHFKEQALCSRYRIKRNSPGLLRDCQKVVLNLTKKEQGSSGGTNFNSFSKDAWIRTELDFVCLDWMIQELRFFRTLVFSVFL